MRTRGSTRWLGTALAAGLIALVIAAAPVMPAGAATVSGEATALRATVLGTTTALAGTGPLAGEQDARNASVLTGSITGVGGAEALHAATISSIYGWDELDFIMSQAALAELAVEVAGSKITAALAIAEAFAPVGASATGWSSVEKLAVNGVPITLTGTENETISLPGLRIVANEVTRTSGGIVVNALHIRSLDGAVDIVVSSAAAGIGF